MAFKFTENLSERPAFLAKSFWKSSLDHPYLEILWLHVEKELFEPTKDPFVVLIQNGVASHKIFRLPQLYCY